MDQLFCWSLGSFPGYSQSRYNFLAATDAMLIVLCYTSDCYLNNTQSFWYVKCTDEKIKLWLFLPGCHSSVVETAQAALSKLRGTFFLNKINTIFLHLIESWFKKPGLGLWRSGQRPLWMAYIMVHNIKLVHFSEVFCLKNDFIKKF